MTLEKRQTPRDKVHLTAFANVEGGGSTILNLSEAGMGVQSTSPLAAREKFASTEVRVSVDLPATQTAIEARGVVTWSDASGRAGVRFVNLTEGSRSLLREFLSLNAAAAPATNKPAELPQQNEAPAGEAAGTRDAKNISDAALQVVAERARILTGACGAAVALIEGDAMVCRAACGELVPPVGTRLSLGSGISAECVRARAVLRCDDTETDAAVDREICRALGIRSLVVVPVMQGGEVVGVVEVISSQPRAFANYDQPGLERLIEQILSGRGVAPGAKRENNVSPTAVPSSAATDAGTADSEKAEGRSSTWELLENLRQPDSWVIRNRVALGVVAGTMLGVVVFSLSPRLQHRAVPVRELPGPASISEPGLAAGGKTRPVEIKKESSGELGELQKLAGSGDADAQFSLGARYATGDQVRQDYGEAAKWFAQSAEQGHVVAQAALGACYWAGRGVPQDYVKSYMWSSLAKLGGDEASKYRVAVIRPRMSNSQIVEAEKLVHEWLREHPQHAAQFSSSAQLQR